MRKIEHHLALNIKKKADYFNQLLESALSILPESFRGHIWVVEQNNMLTVFSDSTVIATQLRYFDENLRIHLCDRFNLKIRRVHIKIIAPSISSVSPTKGIFSMNKSTAKLLHSSANNIEDHELREALLRLTQIKKD